MFLIGLIVGIAATFFVLMLIMAKRLFRVTESRLDFNETAERIVQAAAENNWNMPNQYDLQETLRKHGYEVKPVKVFSICKPELANQILSGNGERLVSALMPCRLAIYESNDGKTYVSRLNPGLFSGLLNKNVKNVIVAANAETELILDSLKK